MSWKVRSRVSRSSSSIISRISNTCCHRCIARSRRQKVRERCPGRKYLKIWRLKNHRPGIRHLWGQLLCSSLRRKRARMIWSCHCLRRGKRKERLFLIWEEVEQIHRVFSIREASSDSASRCCWALLLRLSRHALIRSCYHFQSLRRNIEEILLKWAPECSSQFRSCTLDT